MKSENAEKLKIHSECICIHEKCNPRRRRMQSLIEQETFSQTKIKWRCLKWIHLNKMWALFVMTQTDKTRAIATKTRCRCRLHGGSKVTQHLNVTIPNTEQSDRDVLPRSRSAAHNKCRLHPWDAYRNPISFSVRSTANYTRKLWCKASNTPRK